MNIEPNNVLINISNNSRCNYPNSARFSVGFRSRLSLTYSSLSSYGYKCQRKRVRSLRPFRRYSLTYNVRYFARLNHASSARPMDGLARVQARLPGCSV